MVQAPNWIVPTAPPGTSNNQTASTEFVQQAIFSVKSFGAVGDGVADDAPAIQAAINAAAISTARGTVYFPYTTGGYKINSTLTWLPNVNFYADAGAVIIAGTALNAMLQTGLGTLNRLRNAWLHGGRWDANFLSRRIFWIRDAQEVWLTDFVGRRCGTFVDGINETESSYIRLGDPGQSATCFEIMVNQADLYRVDDAASPTPAPANNYGIYSNDGASDCQIHNIVISGAKSGIVGQTADWKIDKVHIWNDVPTHGALLNGIWLTSFSTSLSNVQIDASGDAVPIRLSGGTGIIHVLNEVWIACPTGSDNTNPAISVDANTTVVALGTFVNCDPAHRFTTDFGGSLDFVAVIGSSSNNVVSPLRQVDMRRNTNAEFTQIIRNANTGAAVTCGYRIQVDAGNCLWAAHSIAGGASCSWDWGGSGGVFIAASHANGSVNFQTGGNNTRVTVDSAGRMLALVPTAGVGYGTGAGGVVTQLTNKSTAVTLNTVTGAITMNNAALAAGTIVSFVLNDSAIAATDLILAMHESGGTTGAYTINGRATGAGSAAIDVRNNTAGSLSEAIVIRFAVVKSVNA